MWPFAPKSRLRRASFVIRRLAWAGNTSCTKLVDQVITRIARHMSGPKTCDACRRNRGDTSCSTCPLNPVNTRTAT